MKKLENPARSNLQEWLDENARLLKSARFDKHNHILMYSVAGHPVIILDMYSKTSGDYQGFEVLTQLGGNSVSEALNKLEELQN